MSKQSDDYSWLGWIAAAVIAVTFVIYVISSGDSSDNSVDTTSESSTSIEPSIETMSDAANTVEPSSGWKCYDATSYNQNAFDDNRCTNGTETRYVSDSQAIELDPGYSPGKSGASYYNAQ